MFPQNGRFLNEGLHFSYFPISSSWQLYMMVVKNKSVSLCWEVNSVFIQILKKRNCFVMPPI